MDYKMQCLLCDAVFLKSERLVAAHPFIEGENIFGCPRCQQCEEGFVSICECEGCTNPVSGGTPTPEGYKSLCYKHLRKYL